MLKTYIICYFSF